MESRKTINFSFKIIVIMLSFLGITLVLIATSRYGIGLSPDSIGYISTARNLGTGNGFLLYDGNPTVLCPPLYPAILALTYKTFGFDPLNSARVINAIIFGLIVYLSGFLILRYVDNSLLFMLVGILFILFSKPLFSVSIMAWTEPLFILFVLLFLISLGFYMEKGNKTLLGLLSASVALASLTRYIGVTLILSTVIIVLFLHNQSIKNKLIHLFLFGIVSTLPFSIWAIRNFTLTGTLFGTHAPSMSSYYENLYLTLRTFFFWLLPHRITEHRSILMIFSMIVGYLVGISWGNNWLKLKSLIIHTGPLIIFTTVYTIFLIYSSTTTAIDPIDDRLLSPIYIPVIIIMLSIVQSIVKPFKEHHSEKSVNGFLVIIFSIWLICPLKGIISEAKNIFNHGAGYNTILWKDSEVIKYLSQHPLKKNRFVYSNAPDALYILAGLSAKFSPSKTYYRSTKMKDSISTWPIASTAYLIWFDNKPRDYLYTIEEMKSICNIFQIVKLDDGSIYTISPKPK